MKNLNRSLAAAALALALCVRPATADTITLTAGDANSATATSFNGAGNWSNAQPPAAEHDYLSVAFLLRTPNNGTSYTFGGHSLTLTGNAVLALKGTASPNIYTMGTNAATGLTLDGGWIGLWQGNPQTVAGYIVLGAGGGGLDPQSNNPLNVPANLSGSGFLKLDSATASGATGGRAVLSGTNTYTGGTVIDANMTLQLSGVGTLGDPAAALTFMNTNNGRGFGALDLNGTSQTVGNLTGGGGRIVNSAAGTTNTLTIGNGNAGGGDFRGNITNGAGVLKLVKTGAATMTLSGTNGYTGGTTIAGGGLQVARISGPLSGTGNLVLLLAPTNTPQVISGSNNFSGRIAVMAGWLAATNDGALGTNSLTVDPYYAYDATSYVDTPVYGPAVFEPRYNLNSAGTLTLANGGQMVLHQNCAFAAVTIEGTPLSAGTHFFSELAASFPNSFLPGGSGAITVQPYGPLPAIGPVILSHPAPVSLYAGRTAVLSVAASGDGTLAYQWQKNGVNLTDGGSLSGTLTNRLVLAGLVPGDAADYRVIVANANGATTSLVAQVSVVLPEDAVGSAWLAAQPVAFYRLNETQDNSADVMPVHDFAGSYNGTYSNLVLNGANGIAGPQAADGYAAFADPNWAAEFYNGYAGSRIAGVAPWNLNTNTVTMTAWVKPNGLQAAYASLICVRDANSCSFGYGGTVNEQGAYNLGYNWNNDGNAWSWNSGITAPASVWSLVCLVVTPTNATIYVINTNTLLKSVRVLNHPVIPFSGAATLGTDSYASNGSRNFAGDLDDVAIFNRALSEGELLNLFTAASGVANFPPAVVTPPVSQTLYAQQTARFTVVASGTGPLSYQWQAGSGGNFTSLVNGGQFAGADAASLTISNLTADNALDYQVIIANALGSITSSVATLTVTPVGPAEDITLSAVEANPQDWETAALWSDGLAASVSAVAKPGSTYRVLANGALRTPASSTTATFPGQQLTVEGNGVFNTTIAGSGAGALILKGATSGSTVTFSRLIMAGGQLFNFINSGGDGTVAGEINIAANTPVYAADDTQARTIYVPAKLTGGGTVEYHGYGGATFRPAATNALVITGTGNTFTGTWNVVQGTLVGGSAGALGTNSITVGAQGALQTAYDLNSPAADLILNGRLYLTRNDSFRTVTVGGVQLAPGTYTAAQLVTAYPANFPTNWLAPAGTVLTNATGSLTVAASSLAAYPTNITFSVTGNTLAIAWPATHRGWMLQQQTNSLATGLATNWTDVGGSTGMTATNFTVDPAQPAVFYRLRHP